MSRSYPLKFPSSELWLKSVAGIYFPTLQPNTHPVSGEVSPPVSFWTNIPSCVYTTHHVSIQYLPRCRGSLCITRSSQPQVQPPLDWLLRVLDTTELQLTSMSPAQQASILCSTASLNLGTSLSTAWRSAYLEASLIALPSMSAAELAAVSGAMLSVRLRPGQRWLAELVACAKGLEFNAAQEQQLVEAITAFGINLRAPPVVVRGKGRPLKSRIYTSGAEVRADVRA